MVLAGGYWQEGGTGRRRVLAREKHGQEEQVRRPE